MSDEMNPSVTCHRCGQQTHISMPPIAGVKTDVVCPVCLAAFSATLQDDEKTVKTEYHPTEQSPQPEIFSLTVRCPGCHLVASVLMVDSVGAGVFTICRRCESIVRFVVTDRTSLQLRLSHRVVTIDEVRSILGAKQAIEVLEALEFVRHGKASGTLDDAGFGLVDP